MEKHRGTSQVWKNGIIKRPKLLSKKNGMFIYTAIAKIKNSRSEKACGISSDRHEAMMKAAMEALERLAFMEAETIARSVSYKRIKKMVTYTWEKYRWFSPKQLKNFPETRNLTTLSETKWVQAYDWIKDEKTYVPLFCLGNSKFPFFVEHSTNGWAAGPNKNFSIERAILELIERDAFLFSWWTKTPPTKIKVNEIPPSMKSLLSAWDQKKINWHIVKFETPWASHVFGTIHLSSKPPYFLIGLGSALCPQEAMQKSINEVVSLTSLRISKRDRSYLPEPIFPDYNIISPTDHLVYYAAYNRNDKIAFLLSGKVKKFDQLKKISGDDLKNDLIKFKQRIFLISAPSSKYEKMGVSIYKAFSPTLIGIDFKHRYRNFQNVRFKKYEIKNTFPHPFA